MCHSLSVCAFWHVGFLPAITTPAANGPGYLTKNESQKSAMTKRKAPKTAASAY